MNKKDWVIVVLVIVVVFGVLRFSKSPDSTVIENPVDYTENETNEADIVSNYVRENIKTIAIDSPVMGGSWYVVSLAVDPENNSGSVVYEDGHIQSSAKFDYTYLKGEISISNFELIQ